MRLVEFTKKSSSTLFEGKEGKLTHLEHLEDLVYNLGYAGANQAVDYLNDIRAMLANGSGETSKISVKWDGAPAIVAGTDPEDGKFFVGTKSVFAKTNPKIIKSLKDINKFYGDEKGGLKDKLAAAFKYLKTLNIRGVLQGDLMFTEGDKVEDTIDGQDMITFTPNTITYAVPVNTQLGQRIRKAKLGIIFHTTYVGPTLPQMKAEPGANVQGLNQNQYVWFDDATYKDLTGLASLTPDENTRLIDALTQLRATIQKVSPKKFDIVLHNKEFAKFIKPYINSLIWEKKQIKNPIQFLKGYIEFYRDKLQAQLQQLKSGENSPAARARLLKIKKQEEFVEDNMNVMLAVLAIYQQIAHIKLALIKKLNSIDSFVNTFRKDDNGYQVVSPEGFVAIGHYGNAVKLVDRLNFSAANRQGTQAWKKK